MLDPSVRFINGKVTASFTIKSSSDKIVFDLAADLMVDSIIYHGNLISFQRVLKDGLQIQLPGCIECRTKGFSEHLLQGIPDPSGTGVFFQGFHRFSNAIWTLSEPYGAKLWWPCKNGLTDKADSIDIIVTYPEEYIVSTNGVLVNEEHSGGKVTTHFKHRYPIASYLVAILVAKYTVAKDSVQMGNRSNACFNVFLSGSR